MVKILIVEDEAIQAASTKMLLEEMGYQVTGVADRAGKALEMADRLPPDIVLTDIMIKGKTDGIALGRELSQRHGCRIIYMTGSPESLTSETSHDGLLKKPFRTDDLLDALEAAIRS